MLQRAKFILVSLAGITIENYLYKSYNVSVIKKRCSGGTSWKGLI